MTGSKDAGSKGAREVWHVTPKDDEWQVRREHGERASSLFSTKELALAAAKDYAKNEEPSQVIVHKMDGKIQKEYTYGQDPVRTKG